MEQFFGLTTHKNIETVSGPCNTFFDTLERRR